MLPFIFNSLSFSNALFESLIWMFHALVFLIPYWVTKFFIVRKGELLPDDWLGKFIKFLKSLAISCTFIIFFLFGGSNKEDSGEPATRIDATLILSAFFVLFVATVIGFYVGYGQVEGNLRTENERVKNQNLLYEKEQELKRIKALALEEFKKDIKKWDLGDGST